MLTKELLQTLHDLLREGVEIPGTAGWVRLSAKKLSSDLVAGDKCDTITFLKNAQITVHVAGTGTVTSIDLFEDKAVVHLDGVPFMSSYTIKAE